MPSPAIDTHKLRSRFIADTVRYAPAVLIPAAVSVASVSVFTRLLDADAYGVYSLVISAVTILTVVAAGWIEQSVLRYLPDYDAARSQKEASARVIGVTAAMCAVVVLCSLIAYLLTRGSTGVFARFLLPASMLLIAEASFLALGSVLQSRLRSRALSTLRSVGAVLRFGMALGLVLWFHRDLRWLLIGTALGRGIVAVATLIMVARDASGWAVPKLDRAVVARFVAYGVPMLGWTLSSRVLGLSDRFVIEAYHGSAAVGVYSANYALVTMGFGLLSGPLLIAAHPLIVAAWKDHGAERAPETIASFSRLYVLGLMPVVAILALCSREVAAILLGHTFREGHEIIPILVLGIFVWGFSMYGHKGLELAERTNIMFVFAAITAAVNVILNFIFVPAYGYKAAAVTTLASAFVYPILVHWVSKRYIPWRIPWATVVQAAGASAAAFMLGALVKRALASNPPLVVASVTSVAMISVYAAILWWLHRRGRNRKGNA